MLYDYMHYARGFQAVGFHPDPSGGRHLKDNHGQTKFQWDVYLGKWYLAWRLIGKDGCTIRNNKPIDI